jgi:hypothetical protein
MPGPATASGRIENLGKNADPGVAGSKPGESVADALADQRALVEEKIAKGRDPRNPGSAAALAQDMHAHLTGQVDEFGTDTKHPRRCMNRRNHRVLLAPSSVPTSP